jgi:hypothetical protein
MLAPRQPKLRTETMHPADAYEAYCAAHGQAPVAPLADMAFRAGALTADSILALVHFIYPFWRFRLAGADHQGFLAIPTRDGDLRLTRERLPRFFGVRAQPGEPMGASGKTIERFLAVYGAARAHMSHPDRIATLLIGLLDTDRAITPASLLARARGTALDPGPDWARSLRRPDAPEGVAGGQWIAQVRQAVALTGWSEAAWAEKGKHVPRSRAFLHRVRVDHLEGLRKELDAAIARGGRREAAQTAAAAPAA